MANRFVFKSKHLTRIDQSQVEALEVIVKAVEPLAIYFLMGRPLIIVLDDSAFGTASALSMGDS